MLYISYPQKSGSEVEKLAKISVNKKVYETSADPATPVLWIIRDELGLTGTKFGCGIAQCGACTIHIDGEPRRACITPLSSVSGKEITTIEGLSAASDHPLQKAWIEKDVPQCGYCQSGQIMAAAAMLAKTRKPTDADIDAAMTGIICRCGTYNRIRAAIKQAAIEGGK
jgi:aerobic-type carbon monoxide dehydrogenase small subunit (CoxS/CutS family)